MHHSVADSSNVVPRARPLLVKHKTAYFDHDDQKKHSVSHTACTSTNTIFFNSQNQTLSPNCAVSFLGLRPVRLSSLDYHVHQVSFLFMTCAAKRQSQLSSGLSSAMRTVV